MPEAPSTAISLLAVRVPDEFTATLARVAAYVRQHFLDPLYAAQAFRRALRELCRTSNRAWGPTRIDDEFGYRLQHPEGRGVSRSCCCPARGGTD